MEYYRNNPHEFFQFIKEDWFGDVDVNSVLGMNDEEQVEFILEHTNRILSLRNEEHQYTGYNIAMMLVEKFVNLSDPTQSTNNPLYDAEVEALLTEEEKGMMNFYRKMAHFMCDLCKGYEFKGEDNYLGFSGEYDFTNEKMMNFVSESKYAYIAQLVACTLLNNSRQTFHNAYNQKLMDMTIELNRQTWIIYGMDLDFVKVDPVTFNAEVVALLSLAKAHLDEGHAMGLSDEEIALHDFIDTEGGPERFEPECVEAAKELCSRTHALLNKVDLSVEEFVDSYMHVFDEVRDKHKECIKVTNKSLAYTYLVTHAENMAYGRKSNT